jgi:hypothetical protein
MLTTNSSVHENLGISFFLFINFCIIFVVVCSVPPIFRKHEEKWEVLEDFNETDESFTVHGNSFRFNFVIY